jgi:hypothetical protein
MVITTLRYKDILFLRFSKLFLNYKTLRIR